MGHFKIKEVFYITGIKNLRKKIKFLQLNYQFQNGEISDEDFEKELSENSFKYLVDVRGIDNAIEFQVINDIVNKLEEDLNIDEISEIFSVDLTVKTK